MQVRITSYGDAAEAIRLVRETVFVREQRVPRKLEWDGLDPDCTHALATDDDGNPIGAGRIQADGKIGRMAVLREWRGQGVGTAIAALLVGWAAGRGLASVYLHAQVAAVPFYEKNGFEQAGAVFVEAGIPHVNMTRRL